MPNWKNVNFTKSRLEFFRYIIFNEYDGICMDPCKVQNIVNWDTSASIHDVKSFLKFANWN